MKCVGVLLLLVGLSLALPVEKQSFTELINLLSKAQLQAKNHVHTQSTSRLAELRNMFNAVFGTHPPGVPRTQSTSRLAELRNMFHAAFGRFPPGVPRSQSQVERFLQRAKAQSVTDRLSSIRGESPKGILEKLIGALNSKTSSEPPTATSTQVPSTTATEVPTASASEGVSPTESVATVSDTDILSELEKIFKELE